MLYLVWWIFELQLDSCGPWLEWENRDGFGWDYGGTTVNGEKQGGLGGIIAELLGGKGNGEKQDGLGGTVEELLGGKMNRKNWDRLQWDLTIYLLDFKFMAIFFPLQRSWEGETKTGVIFFFTNIFRANFESGSTCDWRHASRADKKFGKGMGGRGGGLSGELTVHSPQVPARGGGGCYYCCVCFVPSFSLLIFSTFFVDKMGGFTSIVS